MPVCVDDGVGVSVEREVVVMVGICVSEAVGVKEGDDVGVCVGMTGAPMFSMA